MTIKINKISKKYGSLEVIKELSSEFDENIIIAILGKSGSGKTTLLNIIADIEKADVGEIEGLSSKKISYIFQEDRLIPWKTVKENIEFVLGYLSLDEINDRVEKYLELVDLTSFKNYFPHEISGGMKRRVAIARGFAYDSDILLMDEPFKGLDEKLKKDLIDNFLKVWNDDKRTVICVTHDEREVEMLRAKTYRIEKSPVKNFS